MHRQTQIVSLGVIAVCQAWAQQNLWVPLTTQQKETSFKIGLDGTQTITGERLITISRSSSGSKLVRRVSLVNGEEAPDTARGLLTDARTGNVTEIAYESQSAIMRQKLNLPLHPMGLVSDGTKEDMVDGIRCLRSKVTCVDSFTKTSTQCGTAWYSPEYDLVLRTESEETGREGVRIRLVKETIGLKIGVEPDPAIFAIPRPHSR